MRSIQSTNINKNLFEIELVYNRIPQSNFLIKFNQKNLFCLLFHQI